MTNRANFLRQQEAGRAVLRRGKRFIEFDLGNNRRRMVTTAEPLHYGDGTQEIDTAFVPEAGEFQHKVAAADYEVRARSVINAGDTVEWKRGAEWVRFQPLSLNWVNQDNSRQQIATTQSVAAQVDGDALTWANALGMGRHYRYIAHPERLVKHIIIDNAANLPVPTVTGTVWLEVEFVIKNSAGVELYLDGVRWARVNNVRVTTANSIEFRNASNQVAWALDAPTATDANGAVTDGQLQVRRQGGSSFFITARFPRAWVQAATYPITLDPTLSLQPDAAAGDDTVLASDFATSNFSGNFILAVGENSLSAQVRRMLIKFDLSSIPSGSLVNSAILSLFCTTDNSTNARAFRIYRVKRDWVENQATWTIWKTGNSWSALGGFHADDTEQTDIGNRNFTAAETLNEFKDWTLTSSAVQDMITGGAWTNNGFMIKADTEDSDQYSFASSDNSTAANRPKFVVDYTLSTPAGGNLSRSYSILAG